MTDIKIDLGWTIIWLFIGYSLYTALVSFLWEEKGKRVFENLRVPIIVFIYFGVPCVGLYLTKKAFGGIGHSEWVLRVFSGFILTVSFFVMLYILTVPDWPIGKFTQIHQVPVKVIRYLLSINFAGSLLITLICIVVLVRVPREIESRGFQDLQAKHDRLEAEAGQTNSQLTSLRADATRKALKGEGDAYLATANSLIGIATTFVGLIGSIKALSDKKKSKKGH